MGTEPRSAVEKPVEKADLEELSILAPDGSSAELFTAHLQRRILLANQ